MHSLLLCTLLVSRARLRRGSLRFNNLQLRLPVRHPQGSHFNETMRARYRVSRRCSLSAPCRRGDGSEMKPDDGAEEKGAEPSSATNEPQEGDNEPESDLKKGAWTPEEDKLLSQLIEASLNFPAARIPDFCQNSQPTFPQIPNTAFQHHGRHRCSLTMI